MNKQDDKEMAKELSAEDLENVTGGATPQAISFKPLEGALLKPSPFVIRPGIFEAGA